MILMIFSHLIMMPRMLLSSSCILVIFLCLSHESTGRHLSSIDSLAMDDNAKLLSHSTIKGFENDLLTVHDDLNLKMTENGKGEGKNQISKADNDHHNKTGCKSQNKKDMNKEEKLKKVEEEPVHHHHHHRHQLHRKSDATVTFRVPPRNMRIHQQPGFNLDYSPPKTHPPSHN